MRDYNESLIDDLGKQISDALRENNKPIIDAINNLAKNTGNKTTRAYNELKTKYEELEKKYKKSDCLLKSIITMYTFIIYSHNYWGDTLNSDRIVEVMDETYNDIQSRQRGFIPDVLYDSIIDTSNEVYEKLIRR